MEVEDFSFYYRTIWVRSYSIPLHGWVESTFNNIESKVGLVVRVVKEIIERLFLKYDRVCLQVDRPKAVNEEMRLDLFNNHYSLSL